MLPKIDRVIQICLNMAPQHHISLPIGMKSEEAQESRNKDLRNFREQHLRKNSRKNGI